MVCLPLEQHTTAGGEFKDKPPRERPLISGREGDSAVYTRGPRVLPMVPPEECPEFIPEAECLDRPMAKWSYDFTLQADTLTKTPLTGKLPQREGSYWRTARTTGLAGRPVLRQRFVRPVRPPVVPAALRECRFVVLGGEAVADAWFPSPGLPMSHDLDGRTPARPVVVIWNAAHLTFDEKRQTGVLREFMSRGGRVVVLATRSWDGTERCDIKVGDTRGSRVFLYPGAKPTIRAGLPPEWRTRQRTPYSL